MTMEELDKKESRLESAVRGNTIDTDFFSKLFLLNSVAITLFLLLSPENPVLPFNLLGALLALAVVAHCYYKRSLLLDALREVKATKVALRLMGEV